MGSSEEWEKARGETCRFCQKEVFRTVEGLCGTCCNSRSDILVAHILEVAAGHNLVGQRRDGGAVIMPFSDYPTPICAVRIDGDEVRIRSRFDWLAEPIQEVARKLGFRDV